MKSKKHKKEEQYRPATIDATLQQLQQVGIDEDLNGREVKVYDVDKYGGIFPPCSKVIVDSKFEWLRNLGVHADYIIPTRWLKFND